MYLRQFVPFVAASLIWAGCGPAMEKLESSKFAARDAQAVKLASDLGMQHLYAQHPDFAQGAGTLVSKRVFLDERGGAHTRLAQYVDGVPVLGGQAIVHLKADGSYDSVTDGLVRGISVSTTPALGAQKAIETAVAAAGGWSRLAKQPQADLYLIRYKETDYLAYRVQLEGAKADGSPTMPVAFVNAHRDGVIWSYDDLQHIRNRNTYDAKERTQLPGTLARSESQGPVADAIVNMAHDNAGLTYDFYWNQYGRDSYNGTGGTLTSSVHYSKNYVNAFWNGVQMVYGDGNGVDSSALTVLDVVAHELTHAVTDTESDLIYANESGALNEAMSDIFGAAIEAARDGAVSGNTWKIGEECWTPSIPGDALRYMNDPALAGDYDYWPTRYTGTSDNGGVHWNSGIANLAFNLMTVGGTHPRGKTSNNVPALNANPLTSINMAAAIFYNANTEKLVPSSDFADARGKTVQAATELYGATAANAVDQAWIAVGVPAPLAWNVLDTKSNLSGGSGSQTNYSYATPAGATRMKFAISGGSGDADLYVKFGSAPTTTSYDCRPYAAGNAETCTFDPSQNGTYYVMIRGYSAYSALTLQVSYTN